MYPRLASAPLTTWVAVGGSPQSVVRAAHYGLPLMLAIIGGSVEIGSRRSSTCTTAPSTSWTRSRSLWAGTPTDTSPATDDQARERMFKPWLEQTSKIGRERGGAG